MALFNQPFLSKAGQKERLQNVGATLKAAVTGKGVQSNTGAKIVDKPLSFLASNPFLTAGAAAVALNPSVALTAVKTAPKTTLGVSAAAPILTSAIVSNPKGASKLAGKAAGVTQDLSNFAGNVASINSFQDIATTAKENPLLTAGVIAGAGLAVKGGISAISTAINTGAIKENTNATRDILDLTKNSGLSSGAANAPLSDSQTKFIPESKLTSTNTPAAPNALPSSSAGVNIQQNNYYNTKYLKKLNYG